MLFFKSVVWLLMLVFITFIILIFTMMPLLKKSKLFQFIRSFFDVIHGSKKSTLITIGLMFMFVVLIEIVVGVVI